MKRTKGSQSEIGMSYKYAVTTLLAAQLSENNQVQDYVISSRKNLTGTFDDVVAKIKLKDENDWYCTLIRVKHKENKRFNLSDNLKAEGIDYVLSRYIQCFNEILDDTELSCRYNIPNDNIGFVIFCTKKIQTPVFLRQECTFKIEVCPVSEEKLRMNNILLPFGKRRWNSVCEDLQKSEYQRFFDRCCLYLEKPSCKKINEQLSKICGIHRATEIIDFVNYYLNNRDLRNQGLRKEVFEIEMQKIRLFEYIPPLISIEDLIDDGRIAIFNDITLQHDITAINDIGNFLTESYLYSCLVQKVNVLLNIDIDWKAHISKKSRITSDVIDKFKTYAATKNFRYWTDEPNSLKCLLIELWKCGDLPLILKPQLDYNFKKYSHLNRNYVVIDDWTAQSQEISTFELKIFSCLSNIASKELQDKMLRSTLVSLQGRKPITLKDLLDDDKELTSTFTSADILGMMSKKTPFLTDDCFKGYNYLVFIIEDDNCAEVSELLEPYILGHNIRISCPPDKINDCIKIIQAHDEIYRNYTICHLQKKNNKLVLIKGDTDRLRHYFVDQYKDPLFFSDNAESVPIIGQPTKLHEHNHIQRQLRKATLPRSFSASHISYDAWEYSENDSLHEINNKNKEITVITGDAGIGKTSFLKWMCNNYSTTNYIVFYDLINLQRDLNKNKESHQIDPVDFILKQIQKKLPNKYINFILRLWRKQKIIWLLDSFDEIRLACEEEVLDFIRHIVKTGAQIVIAARTENCKVLIEQFGVQVMKISPLEENKCISHWKLNQDLLDNVSYELITNPLYLNFLKLISERQEQITNITKFSLYEKIIYMKVRDYLQRTYRVLNNYEVEQNVSLLERLALVAMFGHEIIKQELYWACDKEVSDMAKFGIITHFDSDGYPIFYHSTFVEFLVAYWMTKAHQINVYKSTARHLYRHMLNENRLHLLNILFEDVELHKNILQSDDVTIEHIAEEDANCWDIIDKLGRTALHAAVIGCRYPKPLSASYTVLENIVEHMLRKNYDMDKRDTILAWNWTEYFHPEMFEFAYVFDKIEVIKSYLHLHRKKVEKEKCTSMLFPTKYFNMLLRKAVALISIDMIADLVWLQNIENKTFRNFYGACLELTPEAIFSCDTNIQLEGRLTSMHIACIYGSIPMIKHLIKMGVDVNAVDAFICTPLHYCIMRCSLFREENVGDINQRSKNESAVKLLLEANVDLNPFITSIVISPLYLAVQTMNANVVKMLLQAGVNFYHRYRDGSIDIDLCLKHCDARPFFKNKHRDKMEIVIEQNREEIIVLLNIFWDPKDLGKVVMCLLYLTSNSHDRIYTGTQLHESVYNNNINQIENLLKQGEDINLPNENGYAPLHVAVIKENIEITTFLLDRGADLEVQDKYGYTSLCIATTNDNIRATQVLLNKGANPNTANIFGETPLRTAIIKKQVNVVKLLLEMGANVNLQFNDGSTPLYLATKEGCEDIAKLLLDNGADTEISDEKGINPLFLSIVYQHKKVCQLLLQRGANVNAHTNQIVSPLLSAMLWEDIDIISLLLEKKARVNSEDMDGYTPLHIAAYRGNESLVRLLLEKGASINAKTNKGDSVLCEAANKRQVHIIVLLLKKKVDIDRKGGAAALRAAVCKNSIKGVRFLLKARIDVNSRNLEGYTALHLAALNGYTDIVDYLLKKGSHVNARNECGCTPLHHAIMKVHVETVKRLIDAGADVNTECKLSNLCLHHLYVIDFKSVNYRNKETCTTLSLAKMTGNIDIVNLIQNATQ